MSGITAKYIVLAFLINPSSFQQISWMHPADYNFQMQLSVDKSETFLRQLMMHLKMQADI